MGFAAQEGGQNEAELASGYAQDPKSTEDLFLPTAHTGRSALQDTLHSTLMVPAVWQPFTSAGHQSS